MISLKQITYALAVEKTLHFKKAAEYCAISPSALSTALTELEKQLAIQIFERDNKKVLITPFGRVFLEKAKKIKLELENLEQLSQSQHAPLSFPMSVGVIPTIAPYLLPKVLPALRSQYPNFLLKIVEEQSHVLVDMVRNGELDTAILALPYAHEGLLTFDFWKEDFYWVTHQESSLQTQNEITSAELDRSKLMLLSDGHCLKDQALAVCKLKAGHTNQSLSSTSLHTLVQMVAGKMGSTLVPQIALDQLVNASSELKAIHLNEKGPHRKMAFMARPNYAGVENIETLIKLFRKELKAFFK